MYVERSWMSRRVVRGLLTEEFNRGVLTFLDFTFSNQDFVWDSKIKCPCSRCKLRAFGTRSEVRLHLLKKGFTPHYTLWDQHGERREHRRAVVEQPDPSGPSNPFVDLVMDARGFDFDTGEHDETAYELPNPNAKKFYDLLMDADEPLWNGCKKHTKLSMMTRPMNVKSKYGIPNEGAKEILQIVKSGMHVSRPDPVPLESVVPATRPSLPTETHLVGSAEQIFRNAFITENLFKT
ncbi:Transpos_assoc domain-containing protein [Cephalotus follicularis]|uniref:Transpos_assoc domain-containing protein n=1 Tax=Cephalotus follicularis TaxID=3775 RepID=A0A1Q3APW1_CEPFO|nr:Transpos_assoc domain-containing protein [Cephalotus follicularis]